MDRNAIIGYSYALAGAFAYGAAQVMTRGGVSGSGGATTSPLIGAMISMFAGMLALGFMNLRDLKTAAQLQRRALFWTVLSGLFSSVGVLSMYWALSYVTVSVAAPISSINPLLTLVLAHFFLSQHEKVTGKVILGSVIVVLGVILVTIGGQFQ